MRFKNNICWNFFWFWTYAPLAGSPSVAPAAVSPPPPHTRQTAPLSTVWPNFFWEGRGQLKVEIFEQNTYTQPEFEALYTCSRWEDHSYLMTHLMGYGCGRGIATNSSPPNEGPPVSLEYQTKVNRILTKLRFFKK